MLNASQIFKVIKNMTLIKMNQLDRLHDGFKLNAVILQAKSGNKFIVFLFKFKYIAASWINFFLLLIFRRKTFANVFIFTDKRKLKFNALKEKELRVGLYNLRYFRYPHLYSNLSCNEMMNCLFFVFKNRANIFRYVDLAIKKEIPSLNGYKSPTRNLLENRFLFLLDICLAYKSLSKCNEISTAGHFDYYTSLASLLRVEEKITMLTGYQHGLYEFTKHAHPQKLYFDKYHLLHPESRYYFNEFLSMNTGCLISESSCAAVKFTQSYPTVRKVVGYAMQNDSYDQDIDLLIKLIDFLADNCDVIVYLHPLTPKYIENHVNNIVKFRGQIVVERFVRYINTHIIVTRYSTLGLDYFHSGAKAIFFEKNDKVCISYSRKGNLIFCDSYESFYDELFSIKNAK